MRFMKEAAVYISRLDFNWVPKSYSEVLTHALEALSMQDL